MCVTRSVHGNAAATVKATAAEVRRVDKPGAGGIHFRHESVTATGQGRLEGTNGRRKIAGVSRARDVGVAGGVHGDGAAEVAATPAEVRRVDKGGASRIQLRHGTVEVTGQGRLEGADRRRKIGGVGEAHDVGIAGGVQCDADAAIVVTAAEVSGIDKP